jgi:phenylacetate-CoA ligase
MYTRLYREVLFPFYETTLRRRQTLSRLAALEQSQWQSEAALRELSWRKMLDALKHAEQHVPFYRKRFAEYGVSVARVHAPSDLTNFPILTKQDIRTAQRELVSEQFTGRLIHSATSGSTGEPVRFSFDHRTYEYRMAAAMRSDRWAGSMLGEKELYVWGRPLPSGPLATLKWAAYLAVQQRKILNTFDLDMREAVREISRFRPRMIVGFTTAIYHVARYILEHKSQIDPPKGIITTAEQLSPTHRDTIERAFGARVFDRYGEREIMLIASECERHAGKHINSENVFVEIVLSDKPAPAEQTGEVLVSDLVNRAMPLLRYKNGDISSLARGACACGRGLPMLGSLQGRTADLLVRPDGRLVSGVYFLHDFREYPIDRFQVHQDRDRSITMKIIPGRAFSADTMTKVREELQKQFGTEARITLEIVQDIPLSSGGKHRLATSDAVIDLRGLS